jgi:PPOX class probable F420-dependent enzyme
MPRADRLSPGAVKLLKEKQIANLVTLMPDGSPQITPVWVDVDDDGSHVIVNTARGRQKSNNADRDKRVALSVVDSQDPYRTVVVRGTIDSTRSAAQGADAHIDKLAKKYLDKDSYPFRTPTEERVMLYIKPHHVIESGVA